MDAITKTFKRKVYKKSNGFVEEEIPVTFREIILKDYTASDLQASSLVQEMITLGKENSLFTDEIFKYCDYEDYNFYIAETQVSKKGIGQKPKLLGVAIVIQHKAQIFEGFYGINEEGILSANIDFLVVDKDFRKLGIAENLLDFVFNSLDSEIVSVSLNVEKNNTPAQNLYEKLGFSFIEHEEMYGKMYKINVPEFQVLANIASKGIEYVYMNCNRKDIAEFMENIEENSKFVNSNRIEIKSLKEKYPSSIDLIKDCVLDFEKFRREQPGKTFVDFIIALNGQKTDTYYSVKDTRKQPIGCIKNYTVYKKCEKQAQGLGKKILFTIAQTVESDITNGKYADKSELIKTGKNGIGTSSIAVEMGFDKM